MNTSGIPQFSALILSTQQRQSPQREPVRLYGFPVALLYCVGEPPHGAGSSTLSTVYTFNCCR